MKPWQALAPLLVCPATHEPLSLARHDRIVSRSGTEYRVLDGVPILRPGAVDTADVRCESNPVSDELEDFMRSIPGPVLFLGAGATTFRADNVIEVEYNVFRNTDVVADAHRLPVPDGVVAGVVALNLFEHLEDPARAAGEIRRVLRPHGEVLIHTAFLQPLHEEPAHYYNTTEFGLRRWFDGFSDVTVTVSPNFNPYFALSWCASELLAGVRAEMGAADHDLLAGTTLRELAMAWDTRRQGSTASFHVFERLSESLQRRLAAGFQLTARKRPE